MFKKPYPPQRGFTLLELLVVIGIIAVLALITVLALNPAELLKRSRDARRISDVVVLKDALSYYIAMVTNPDLDIGGGMVYCDTGTSTTCAVYWSGDGVAGSQDLSSLSPATLGSACTAGDNRWGTQDSGAINGSGWLRVAFSSSSEGSPISNLPHDPKFSVQNLSNPVDSDRLYVYACGENPLKFELNANLESAQLSNGGSGDRESTDGGDNPDLFETGSNLNLIQAF